MIIRPRLIDPRYFQILFLTVFLSYGIIFLHWNFTWTHYCVSISGCLFFNYIFESIWKNKRVIPMGKPGRYQWITSVLISSLSLCLLLKTNGWQVSLLASFITVASKYLIRVRGKHIFNPSAFGIVATLIITDQAWLSPAQWGSSAVVFFFIITLGTIIVTKVQKLDVSLAFLITYSALLYWRLVVVLGWPADYFLHSLISGSLLLFSFFMISDPRTSPNHKVARMIWSVMIACIAFYFSVFQWKYNTPIWVLVAMGPVVPFFDLLFKFKPFSWQGSPLKYFNIPQIKISLMKPLLKKIAALFIMVAMLSHHAMSFCGFYVSKADGTLKNKTSQVIIVHDGNHNVITMFNDFQGNFKDFAMVVPVPVVLKKTDINVVDQKIFTTLNEYSQPRLVEYFDENPCNRNFLANAKGSVSSSLNDMVIAPSKMSKAKELGVHIEAKYLVGEYDILILSAKESSGLKTWLEQNGYKIPAGANEVLEPYIKSNLKFFVVKVNENEKKKLPGNFLRPIQISFNFPKFMLPIRLGMANADGDQDMLVYAFSRKGRIECTNYRTVSLPTGKNIPLFVEKNFSSFYSNLFQHQWLREGQSVAMLEYAWDVSPRNYLKCDPCIATAPSNQDLVQAGVWWINRNWNDYSDVTNNDDISENVYFTRLHIRYNRNAFPQDLMFQTTANTENFQARYIITHPATGDLSCEAGKQYLRKLRQRRHNELENLTSLTGKSYSDWETALNVPVEANIPAGNSYSSIAQLDLSHQSNLGFFGAVGILAITSIIGLARKMI